MLYLFLGLGVWTLIGGGVAVIVGRAVRLADQHAPRPRPVLVSAPVTRR